jgi:hypothetical protein
MTNLPKVALTYENQTRDIVKAGILQATVLDGAAKLIASLNSRERMKNVEATSTADIGYMLNADAAGWKLAVTVKFTCDAWDKRCLGTVTTPAKLAEALSTVLDNLPTPLIISDVPIQPSPCRVLLCIGNQIFDAMVTLSVRLLPSASDRGIDW